MSLLDSMKLRRVLDSGSREQYSRGDPTTHDMPAPDSPRSSQSPPPEGIQGDLELELMGLANALYNLGMTVVNDSTREKDRGGTGRKQVGPRVYVSLFPMLA